jgi:Zn finger protein HypA/HybF involved in hydrogenase expression
MLAIPLRNAHLCADCDAVYDYEQYRDNCPACASTYNIALVQILKSNGGDICQKSTASTALSNTI